jgi:hypothetical protein
MHRGFERRRLFALTRLTVVGAALWMSGASADGLQPSRDHGRHDADCRNADAGDAAADEPAGCVRIRGYITAGSDFAAEKSIGRLPSPLEPFLGPLVTGIGAIVTPVGSAWSQGPFLPVRHDGLH